MIHKGQSRGFYFYAWDVSTGAPQTGDASNITIYISQDGGSPSSQGSPTEINASIMPGWYYKELTLTGNSAAVAAISSTSRVQVVLSGVYCNTGAIPSASAGSSGGLPIIGSAPLSYLDAAVSSRADGADYTAARAAKLDNLDTTVSSRAPASTALSNTVWTDARAAKLDNMDATVSSRAPASTALSNTVWTDARAGKLDNLDAAVSSRAAPGDAMTLTSAYDRAKNALSYTEYVAPDNTSIAAIKAKTDQLSFTGGDVKATLDGEQVTVGGYATGQSPQEVLTAQGYTTTRAANLDNLDAAVSSRAAAATALSNTVWTDTRAAKLDNLDTTISSRLASADYAPPDNAGIAAVKAQTDKLEFTEQDGHNLVLAQAQVEAEVQINYDAVAQAVWNEDLSLYTDGAGGDLHATAQKIQSLGTGQVTVVSPVDPKGLHIKIVRGDDYAAADGRALRWSSSQWPDLTGATITFTAKHITQSANILQTAGAVLPPEGGNQTVQVELTSAQTDPLIHGAKTYWYDIEAQLASRRIVTLAKGLMSVEADITR